MYYSYYEVEKMVQLRLEDAMRKANQKQQMQMIRNRKRKKKKKIFSMIYFTSIISKLGVLFK